MYNQRRGQTDCSFKSIRKLQRRMDSTKTPHGEAPDKGILASFGKPESLPDILKQFSANISCVLSSRLFSIQIKAVFSRRKYDAQMIFLCHVHCVSVPEPLITAAAISVQQNQCLHGLLRAPLPDILLIGQNNAEGSIPSQTIRKKIKSSNCHSNHPLCKQAAVYAA